MKVQESYIERLRKRQDELALSTVVTILPYERYIETAARWQGLQESIETLEKTLEESDEQEKEI